MDIPKEIKDKVKEIDFNKNIEESQYEYVRYKGNIIARSRAVWIKNKGDIPEGMIIHHINCNKKDDRLENLMILSFQEHMRLHKEINGLKKSLIK